MSDNECREWLSQLPAAFLAKREDNHHVIANSACLMLFGAQLQHDEFVASLTFYDGSSKQPDTGDLDPFTRCATSDITRLRLRINSQNRNLNCLVEGRRAEIGGARWVVLHVINAQDNDLPSAQADFSPLANHLAFNHLLSAISSQLINVSTRQLDTLIERSLGAFGEFSGVDRCYLFRFSPDKLRMSNTHEWVAPGVTPYKDELQNMAVGDLPYFTAAIKQQHVFCVSNVDELPGEAASEKAEFQRERIRSVLCVAVHLGDDLYGFVGCDSVGSTYEWRDHDIRYLKLIGEMLSNTLQSVANRLTLQQLTQQLEDANKQLVYQANSDGLTGIANRRQFDGCLEKAVKSGIRRGKFISLLMVDVDLFKQFNDSYGHGVGDEALRAVAHALTQCCKRTDDLAARYGGEEFAVILPDTNFEQGHYVAEQIMEAIESLGIPFKKSPANGVLTVSIGIATRRCSNELLVTSLLSSADQALYKAKTEGRNRIASA
ncbi:sensor domain-containing diguanylate cyclase [Alteromonas sp. ASW11-19]|uniref:diguanylate cyclase n=1 Tax=Alteromonas salexigens TaxID=2982530 RepID=A0ABT2VM69_9ALTE|nr:sensor domain-containing diguanylate cyclase [Alteromonas salexigens]MCU7554421.1 sensor domain-containing diguanylate cyclase [Alteromonas salexigens]